MASQHRSDPRSEQITEFIQRENHSSGLPVCTTSAGGSQDFEKACKGVPVARSNRSAEMLFDSAQKSNGLHRSPIETKGEPSTNRNELDQPVLAGREVERQCGLDPRWFGKNTHEADDPRVGGFADKRFCG